MDAGGTPVLQTPVLQTARLVLTPVTQGDAAEMALVLADPALHEFTGGSPLDEVGLRATYRRWSAGSERAGETWLNWIVRVRDGGQAAGHVQATVIMRPVGQAAEVAWVIGTAWQGRGFATESARALAGWLVGAGVTELTACIHPAHRASELVAERAGFTLTSEVIDGERVWRYRQGRSST